jgi:AraC-like DNA-binding protein
MCHVSPDSRAPLSAPHAEAGHEGGRVTVTARGACRHGLLDRGEVVCGEAQPGAYLREERLLAAQVMLCDQRYARSETSRIAAAVGPLDLRTFERAFLRQYGVTPAGWRRQHGRAGAPPAPVLQEVPPH